MTVTMTVVWIRVLAGFLAGLAAGILIMRMAYKKHETMNLEEGESNPSAMSSKAS